MAHVLSAPCGSVSEHWYVHSHSAAALNLEVQCVSLQCQNSNVRCDTHRQWLAGGAFDTAGVTCMTHQINHC